MTFLFSLLLALAALNFWTFILFGWDKMKAEEGGWRVSEASLLGLALIGGIGGAYAGRAYFRHKTRKKSFNMALQYVGFFQLVTLTFCSVYFYEPGGWSTPARAEMAHAVAQTSSRLVYYPNCDWARDLGAAPIRRGEPGYRAELDRDDDGIACEPYRRRY